jgi:hypothetical protein
MYAHATAVHEYLFHVVEAQWCVSNSLSLSLPLSLSLTPSLSLLSLPPSRSPRSLDPLALARSRFRSLALPLPLTLALSHSLSRTHSLPHGRASRPTAHGGRRDRCGACIPPPPLPLCVRQAERPIAHRCRGRPRPPVLICVDTLPLRQRRARWPARSRWSLAAARCCTGRSCRGGSCCGGRPGMPGLAAGAARSASRPGPPALPMHAGWRQREDHAQTTNAGAPGSCVLGRGQGQGRQGGTR